MPTVAKSGGDFTTFQAAYDAQATTWIANVDIEGIDSELYNERVLIDNQVAANGFRYRIFCDYTKKNFPLISAGTGAVIRVDDANFTIENIGLTQFGNKVLVETVGINTFVLAVRVLAGHQFINTLAANGLRIFNCSSMDSGDAVGDIMINGCDDVKIGYNAFFPRWPTLGRTTIALLNTNTNVIVKKNIIGISRATASNSYGINVAAGSEAGLTSDDNTFILFGQLVADNPQIGFWSGAAQATLAAWRTASGQDALSNEVRSAQAYAGLSILDIGNSVDPGLSTVDNDNVIRTRFDRGPKEFTPAAVTVTEFLEQIEAEIA